MCRIYYAIINVIYENVVLIFIDKGEQVKILLRITNKKKSIDTQTYLCITDLLLNMVCSSSLTGHCKM